MDTRHASVLVDGMRLHWAECGTATDKAPLVLLHGINDSHLTWKRIAPALAADRRVLMPDAPGCGLSERPDASYHLDWHAHVIARWLEVLGLSEVDVAGHSFGGGVAQMLLLEPTLNVRRLALIASGGLGPHIAFWLRLATLPGVVELFGQPFMAAGTRLTLRAAGGRISEQDIAELSAMNAAPGTARAFARTVENVVSWRGQSQNFFQHIHEIQQVPPITLFWGDQDGITPLEDALSFARTVKGVGFERFEGCGHYLHHEQPDDLSRRLREFLDTFQTHALELPVLDPFVALSSPWAHPWEALLAAVGATPKLPEDRSVSPYPAPLMG